MKNLLTPTPIFEDADMSSEVISPVLDTLRLDRVAIQLIFTGTPTGEFFVEGSLDFEKNVDGSVRNPGTWTPLDLASPLQATGGPDQFLVDILVTAMPNVRVRYAQSGGTGVLNGRISGKAS